MGKAVEKIAKQSGHEVVAIFTSAKKPTLNGAEVMIDFSQISGVDEAVSLACDDGVDLVIGTTGWNDRLDAFRKRIEQAGIGCTYASNFSPGANVVFALAHRAGEMFARFPQYAAGMEERHHAQKKDAPSGTALRIAKEVKGGSGGQLDPPIVASRGGGEVGGATLFFDSPDDPVEVNPRAPRPDGLAPLA